MTEGMKENGGKKKRHIETVLPVNEKAVPYVSEEELGQLKVRLPRDEIDAVRHLESDAR